METLAFLASALIVFALLALDLGYDSRPVDDARHWWPGTRDDDAATRSTTPDLQGRRRANCSSVQPEPGQPGARHQAVDSERRQGPGREVPREKSH